MIQRLFPLPNLRRGWLTILPVLLTLLVALMVWQRLNAPARADPPGCAFTTVNDPDNACYTLTASRLGTAIALDGVNTGGEWNGATTKTFTGTQSGALQFGRRGGDLYLFITVNDAAPNDEQDRIFLRFDPLHENSLTQNHRGFVIERCPTGGSPDHEFETFSGGTLSYSPTLPAGITIAVFPADCSTPTTTWSAEVRIQPGALSLPDLPPLMGFAAIALSPGTSGFWPQANLQFGASPSDLTPATWANLKTRYPLEYMLVLDHSGSMLDNNRWNEAVSAANYLANTMAILRDVALGTGMTPYFDDRVGLITFGWNNSTNVSITSIAKPLSTVGAFPLGGGDYVGAAPAVGLPNSATFTPIGNGLDVAFGAVDAANAGREVERVILLLSDGHHNRPMAQTPLLPTHLAYNPCPAVMGWACPAGTASNVVVDTVAVGTDGTADTALLQNIADRFGGDLSDYQITADASDLRRIFIQALDDLYQMNMVSDDTASITTGGVMVDSGNRKIVLILAWDVPGQADTFNVQRNGSAVTCDDNDASTTVGFAMCVINFPQAGTYRVAPAPDDPPSRAFIVADLSLRANFDIGDAVAGTGLPLLLTADMNHIGIPMSATNGYTVEVSVARENPEEGLGNFMATHLFDDCEKLDAPIVPQIPDDLLGVLLDRNEWLNSGVLFLPYPDIIGAIKQNPLQGGRIDIRIPLYQGAAELLRACGLDDLPRQDETLKLVDDGTQGDAVANDGIYSLAITPEIEGSETYRFTATGSTPDGEQFMRTRVVSRYIRTEVDIASSGILSTQSFTVLDDQLAIAYFVAPQDSLRRYLGPGRGDQVTFVANSGEWISPTIDFNNGVYARILLVKRGEEEPVVEPVIQGKSPSGQVQDPYDPDRPTPECPVCPECPDCPSDDGDHDQPIDCSQCPPPDNGGGDNSGSAAGLLGLSWEVLALILGLIIVLLLLLILLALLRLRRT